MSTTRTRKSTAAKKSTTAPKATVKKGATSVPVAEADRDWSYLAEKAPTDLHEDFAKWLESEVGIEVDLKTVQVVCVLRMVYQRSQANKARSTYRPLAQPVVAKRSEHMHLAHVEAAPLVAAQKAKATKATPAKKTAPAKRTPAKRTPARKSA